jgi:hypothetical protein
MCVKMLSLAKIVKSCSVVAAYTNGLHRRKAMLMTAPPACNPGSKEINYLGMSKASWKHTNLSAHYSYKTDKNAVKR